MVNALAMYKSTFSVIRHIYTFRANYVRGKSEKVTNDCVPIIALFIFSLTSEKVGTKYQIETNCVKDIH